MPSPESSCRIIAESPGGAAGAVDESDLGDGWTERSLCCTSLDELLLLRFCIGETYDWWHLEERMSLEAYRSRTVAMMGSLKIVLAA